MDILDEPYLSNLLENVLGMHIFGSYERYDHRVVPET